jgi:hypothetical protein
LGRCFSSPAQAQIFETLPPHFIPWHPSPTQQSQRYLRCTSFLSCRVARSLAPLTTPLGFFSWGTHSPGLPSRSRRRHRRHVPLYTAVMATAPLWSRPSARAGPGHVATTSSCRGETACPPSSRNGTGLDATHSPRIWSLSPSDSLGGPVTVRGHARLKPTWFPLSRPCHAPSGAD